MLNIRDLERRWLKHKIKSYFPHLFGSLAVIFIIALISIFYSQEENSTIDVPQNTKEQIQPLQSSLHVNEKSKDMQAQQEDISEVKAMRSTVTEIKTINETNSAAPEQLKTITQEYQPKKLQPSYSFLDSIESEKREALKTEVQQQRINTAIKPAFENKVEESSKIIDSNKAAVQSEPKHITPTGIKIDRAKSQQEIQDIIRRFEKRKTPALGLYLARYYYKLKNYEKSYNYALSTNNIDPDIEESWLIFASSQVKLGNKDEAIKTLLAYIKSSDSMNAKSLLRSIRNGEFQ